MSTDRLARSYVIQSLGDIPGLVRELERAVAWEKSPKSCPHVNTTQYNDLEHREVTHVLIAGREECDCEVCRKLKTHDDLLAACKLAVATIKDLADQQAMADNWFRAHLETINTAIAKAEREP